MDLIKALDYISRDLLIAKMHAYGFSRESLNFFHSHPKRGQNSVEDYGHFKTERKFMIQK